MRVIFHVDMDAFYASIEQRDHPDLRGLPVIVGGDGKRGVVSTCSYEARTFGVHSALPMVQAMRLCPQAIVMPVRMRVYSEVSAQIMEILGSFSPLIEPLSLDEAFLDMSGTQQLFGEPLQIARAIKDEVLRVTQLPCSVGIAANKFLAKLASDLEKPDAITLIPFGREREFIAPLSVRKLWGVGPKAEARFRDLGLRTFGQVAACELDWLEERLGSIGAHVYHLARAEDDREVVTQRERKSVGSERTLSEDIRGYDQVERVMWQQCERVGRHLRGKGLVARSVRVKIRYSRNFQLMTRDAALPLPTDDSAGLMSGARQLMAKIDLQTPIRLVGVAAFQLDQAGCGGQADLFLQPKRDKHSKVEHTMDAIRDKFGNMIQRGSTKTGQR